MDLEIVEGKIGEVGAYDVELKAGKLTAKIGITGPAGAVSGEMVVSIDGALLLDKIKAEIPGEVDDAFINILKGVLLA